jgi:carboxyl-terminal processing protease
MKRKQLLIGLLLGLLLGLGLTSVTLGAREPAGSLPTEVARPISWLLDKVHVHYVEEVNDEELVTGAVQGMLSKLDDYSSYMPAEMLEDFRTRARGEFGGLGIQIRFDPVRKVVVVEHPLPGTPAFRAGVLAGDLIVEVREQSSDEVTETSEFENVYDAVRVLRGKPGTEVSITVLRGEEHKKRDITIKRDIIEIASVRATEMVDEGGKIGYVYVADFTEKTAGDLVSAIEQFQEEGAEGVILDLRFNPGGLLESALQISDMFLDNKMIVRTAERNGPARIYPSEPGERYPDLELVVLVNRYSASASEILAAALSDNGRAVVVGEPTHGKASVQQIFHLPPPRKDAVKLTIAHYYTPANRPIAKDGVKPDVEVKIEDEDIPKLVEDLSRKTDYAPDEPDEETTEETASEDEGEQVAQEEFSDVQLERAKEVMSELLAEKRGYPEPEPAQTAMSPSGT